MVGLAPVAAALCCGPRHFGEHLARLHRVGSQRQDSLLSAIEPCPGNHLHGARDLLRRLDAYNSIANDFEIGHRLFPGGGELFRKFRECCLKFCLDFFSNFHFISNRLHQGGLTITKNLIQFLFVFA